MDRLERIFFSAPNIKGSVVVCTRAAREAQKLHGLHEASAAILAQAIAGAMLVGSLQKEASQVNLQIECDGPLRGLFVDAGNDGAVRGYVKNPYLRVEGNAGEFRFRPLLGNTGYISVLKDLGGGEYYRSSVELVQFSLGEDLERYFAVSDQVPTKLSVAALPVKDEPLGAVAGVLLQTLPQGELGALAKLSEKLTERLESTLLANPDITAGQLAEALFGGEKFEVVGAVAVEWKCTCSKDRVMNALSAMGKTELQSLLQEQGQAAATCQFCGKKHVAGKEDLEALIARLPDPPKS